jgi:multidrug resistance efflux pump
MKKINVIYILAILVALLLYRASGNYQRESLVFYGFAENKETEINAEYPVEVKKLYVTTGQKVKAGTVLADTEQADLPKKQEQALFKIQELKAEKAEAVSKIKAQINQIEARIVMKTGEIDSEIALLKRKAEQNRVLLKDLGNSGEGESMTEARVAALKKEKDLIIRPLKVEIDKLKAEFKASGKPRDAQIQSLENEIDFYTNKTEKFALTAPSDGLIGNIHVKEAEFVPSFQTLITFYEENPTLVQGFVHESMILKVAVGDSLEVVSSLHEKASCRGIVTGLGSRIVEIPSRLRKMQEIKTYGREILIKIPRDNSFMQKEKVILKLGQKDGESSGFFSSRSLFPFSKNSSQAQISTK